MKKFFSILFLFQFCYSNSVSITGSVFNEEGKPSRKALVNRLIEGGILEGNLTDFIDDKGNFKLNNEAKLQKVFQDNADKLGVPNPFREAAPAINKIMRQLISVPLTEEATPQLINPFDAIEETPVSYTHLRAHET